MPNEILPPTGGDMEQPLEHEPGRPRGRMIGFSSRNPLAIALVGGIALAAGAVLLTLGLALILALVAGATALGVSALVVRSLTSKPHLLYRLADELCRIYITVLACVEEPLAVMLRICSPVC